MKFAEPIWLFAGLAVISGLFWLYRRIDLRQRAALAEFASNHLLAKLTASFSPGRRRVKRLLFTAALAFTFIALARPQLGFHWEEEKHRGIDILFAIDTSKSMLTQDVTPDRLTRAKLAITDLVQKLDGDRVGLIAFAGDAFLQAPLTLDTDAFRESLDALDTNVIPRGGTDIASAIEEADAAFGKESKNHKILVLVTDGEDLEAKGIAAAKDAAKDGLVIYTVGVGSSAGGVIPITSAAGGTEFLKDDSGQFVKSHLDESTLKQIAEATGGIYQPLGQQGQGLQAIYDQALSSMPKQDVSSKRQKVYDERFQWPLAAALACLFASMMIGTRRRDVKRVAVAKKAALAASTAVVMALMTAPSAQASPQSAERAYKNGDFPKAEQQYQQSADQQPETPPLQFNLGASAYKTGDFDKALPAFQKALNSQDVPVQQQAYYDMGNTQYRLGQKTEKSSPDDTIKTWQSAVQSYDAALKLKPEDADAKFNRDFVQKKLDQLQKQQKQNQKQDQKQDQKKDQQDKQDQKQNQQNQQNQDQQKQDQKNQDQKNQQQSGSGQDQQKQDQQKQDQQNQQGQDQKNDQAKNDQKPGQQGSGQDQKNDQANQQKPDQSKNDQAKNDQKQGQQDQAKDGDQKKQDGQQGQQQTAGNQDQQKENGQGASTAQNNAKPVGPRGATIPDKDQGKPEQQQQAEAEAAAGKPGELTKEEAKALLNSLKNGEHALPVTADVRGNAGHPQDAPVLKDW